jgi:hypothetical protein
MLAHDIANKIFAIIGYCESLDRRVPSPWVLDETIKIRAQALAISDMLQSPQCTEECTAPNAAR